MGTTTKNLKTLLDHVDAGELVLPEIQRDFVWKRNNVLLLFDSLYRRLPIGYMLVWKAKTSVARKKFKGGRKQRVGHAIDSFYGYLLDGQQRLTAIQLVRDADDNYPLMFSLWPRDEKNPDDDRFVFAANWNNNPWYVSVSDVISGQITPIRVVDRLKDDKDFDYDSDADKIYAAVTKLQGIMDYEVGIIDFEDNDYRKATQLFIRFNSTGKKLNRNDLVAAELALTVPNLVSEGIDSTAVAFSPDFYFTKAFLILCLMALHTDKMNLKNPSDIWKNSNEREIKGSWNKTSKGISRTIEFLTGTVKWDSDSWIPSINSLIPLIYLLSKGEFSQNERQLAYKWLLQANVHAIFSGATYSELDRIIRGLKSQPNIQKLQNITRKDMGKIESEYFETRRKCGAAMSLYISMLRNKNAKDWRRQTNLDGRVIGHNAELQVHHFFPQALLYEKGYKAEEVNTFANYTILSKETNINISDDEPIQYLKKFKIKKKDLQDQCIPLDEKLWTVNRYEDFVIERRKLLARNANDIMNSA